MEIIGEHKLRISHCFVCLPDDDWTTITEVNSHPIALMQCREFLSHHLQYKVVECEDTAMSAQNIMENNLHGHAAICSEAAANLFGMKILSKGIETNKHTRFLVVANPSLVDKIHPDMASINKSSLVFTFISYRRQSFASAFHLSLSNQFNQNTVFAHHRARMGISVLCRHCFRRLYSLQAVGSRCCSIDQTIQNIRRICRRKTKCIIFKPADRLSEVREYYFSVKLLKEVARMNAEGKDVISLAIGSPDMPPSDATIKQLCESAHNPDGHGYQPYIGIPELREAFARWYQRWYGVALDPNTEIQPLIGSKEGILHVTLAFVNPGDQVLPPNPGYPTYTL